jgi:hypothetical protein
VTHPDFRDAFRETPRLLARVTPGGFASGGREVPAVEGRVTRIALVRKLFRDSALVCSSKDGVRARDGTLCDECRHPRCQPQLRVELRARDEVLLLDLAFSSARNLLALRDRLEAEGVALEDVVLRLSVLDRGRWGEVLFALADEPPAQSGDHGPVVTPTPPADRDHVAPEKRDS